MQEQQFWDLIEQARQQGGDDFDARAEHLRNALKALPPAEIEVFQHLFDDVVDRAYRWDLWGAAYLIHGGCSDDSFLDFRYWLVSEGRERYEATLDDPDSLADVELPEYCEAESFGYAAIEAFETVGAGDMTREFAGEEEPVGEPWEEEELAERLPRLAARFLEQEEEMQEDE